MSKLITVTIEANSFEELHTKLSHLAKRFETVPLEIPDDLTDEVSMRAGGLTHPPKEFFRNAGGGEGANFEGLGE